MTALVLGSTVFCYRKAAADPLQPEVGKVVSVVPRPDKDGKAQDPVVNVVGWTAHGSTFLMERSLVQSDYDKNSRADFVSGTMIKTQAAAVAEKKAVAAKAASQAVAKAAADALAEKQKAEAASTQANAQPPAKVAQDLPKPSQPIPPPSQPVTPPPVGQPVAQPAVAAPVPPPVSGAPLGGTPA
jgi:hypothetical protein